MAKYTFKPAFPGRLLLASTAVGALALAGPALPADIPVKAPPAVAPVPVFTWTGCYIGGHGGFATALKYYDLTPLSWCLAPFSLPRREASKWLLAS
jgi:hypothetical protein